MTYTHTHTHTHTHTQTSKHANIVMTSVKPIFESSGKDSKKKVGGDYVIDSSTLTRAFRYSIPYTQGSYDLHNVFFIMCTDHPSLSSSLCLHSSIVILIVCATSDRSKVHARGVDQQWKRTTILTVKESFPGIFSRQPVSSFKYIELSPIEVSGN